MDLRSVISFFMVFATALVETSNAQYNIKAYNSAEEDGSYELYFYDGSQLRDEKWRFDPITGHPVANVRYGFRPPDQDRFYVVDSESDGKGGYRTRTTSIDPTHLDFFKTRVRDPEPFDFRKKLPHRPAFGNRRPTGSVVDAVQEFFDALPGVPTLSQLTPNLAGTAGQKPAANSFFGGGAGLQLPSFGTFTPTDVFPTFSSIGTLFPNQESASAWASSSPQMTVNTAAEQSPLPPPLPSFPIATLSGSDVFQDLPSQDHLPSYVSHHGRPRPERPDRPFGSRPSHHKPSRPHHSSYRPSPSTSAPPSDSPILADLPDSLPTPSGATSKTTKLPTDDFDIRLDPIVEHEQVVPAEEPTNAHSENDAELLSSASPVESAPEEDQTRVEAPPSSPSSSQRPGIIGLPTAEEDEEDDSVLLGNRISPNAIKSLIG